MTWTRSKTWSDTYKKFIGLNLDSKKMSKENQEQRLEFQ